MLSAEDNERLTRTGPGTPAGDLLRAYWQPVALVEELPDERPAKPVRLLGEDLVLYRRADGGYGLVGRTCSHRGVDLAFGRLEDGGIRCLYHGWLYDHTGACLEQPAEPPESRFREKVAHPAHPVRAINGIIFAWMGGGEPPDPPAFDAFDAPESHTFAFKGWWKCNWLQGLEGGIDPSHVSFLHRFLDEDPRDTYGQQFREHVDGTDVPLSKLVGDNFRPDIDVEVTGYGLRVYALRDLADDLRHVRITNLLFPNAFVIPFGNRMAIAQWHVPIDDHNHHWYMVMYDLEEATDTETLRAQRLEGVTLPDYEPIHGRHDDWGFDPTEQATTTYTGMGMDINVHDQWAVESIGRIQDRTVEHLGVSDRAVTAYRRQLLRAIDDHAAGRPTPARHAPGTSLDDLGPVAVDMITPRDGWEGHWRDRAARRRHRSPWARDPVDSRDEVDA
ncbi:aromatic ring-hydroxylating dioxygenase subunit alpha [Salsipaludibacter albus]|uniref:aromatic ring-hydroxylating dioxygenase subunit alpha n=1 Tax=Salsipaludibacter albus TaxID=2849650 RepID=UPI001EE3B0C6|nr:aromatic ring-hydroxylating dioxygenase subunit alpha [Salsipaludibacter albus]MBY5163662.1 aromatic ring-hydroxylating dioxygenase subunit alpha [Salsipaludibacter albus]